MDTRFWGPSGWRLLHLIAHSSQAAKCHAFWEALPFVLPCKFCRASLTCYYEKHPIPTKQEDFAEWLYTIHNLVNKKLRDQGQKVPPDPSFSEVKERYTSLLKQGCTQSEFPGWDFVFSIADNHPDSSPSKPMPDAPSQTPRTVCERNKYNLMTPAERKQKLKLFWKCLPNVLPFEDWKRLWNQHAGSITKATSNRRNALSWLWKIRCGLEQNLSQISEKTFHGLCKEVRTHRSGCSKSTRAKTCRKLPQLGGKRKTRTRKQRRG